MRKAEQRCPAESNADEIDVGDDLLGERRGIDHHRIEAAGFGDQRQGRAAAGQAAGELLFDQPRDRGRAGEDDPLDARIGDQRRRRRRPPQA